jgi:hypothetical protein
MGNAHFMNKLSYIISIFLSGFFIVNAQASTKDVWDLAFYPGASFSKNETLTIKQDGYPGITLKNAEFVTKPLDSPRYYGIRLGQWNDGHAWEVGHMHQKIDVDNFPAEVQHFEMADGYKLSLFNSAWQHEEYGVTTRPGIAAGIAPGVAQPQITVRDMFNYKSGDGAIPTDRDSQSGYQWAVTTSQVAFAKGFSVSRRWLLNIKGKLFYSGANIAVGGDIKYVSRRWRLSIKGNLSHVNANTAVGGGIKYDF